MRHSKILPIIAVAVTQSASVIAAETAHLVAPLDDQQTIDGCSWSASAAGVGDGFVFLAEYDESRIVMNIGGSDVQLKLVEAKGQLKKVGDVLNRTFKAGDITVDARYTATWVCTEGSESCETTKFAVTFRVSKGGQSETVQATGHVGC